ncbi:MAG: CPBP family intramembrane metalloprotease [Eubacterium sp.]|nr:CPBP family intramembrane metalloprotease [Eubacterium sp.]
MNYYEIKHSAPRGLRKNKPKRQLTPASVIVFFAIETALFLTFGSIIQLRYGLTGVTITELGMLVLSVGFALLYRTDLRSVFPLHRPKLIGLAGCAVLWFGAILASMLVNLFLVYFFPVPYQMIGEEDSLFQSVPFLLQILIVAILPAVCEEALHRGVMQNGIGNRVKNITVLSVIMGGIFAVFHLYPIKYPGMLILGGMMSYILAISGNMIYSSFVHFLNNFISLLVGKLTGILLFPAYGMCVSGMRAAGSISEGAAAAESGVTFPYIGISIMTIGIFIPILLYVGVYLLKRAEAPVRPAFVPKVPAHPVRNRIVVPTVLIFACGLLITIL